MSPTLRNTHPHFESWLHTWQQKVAGWTQSCEIDSNAGVLVLVPTLLRFLIDVTTDQRVPPAPAAALEQATRQIMVQIRDLDSSFMGIVVLVEHLNQLATVLEWSLPYIPVAALHTHWREADHLEDVVRHLLSRR